MKRIIARADIPENPDERRALVIAGLESGITEFVLRRCDEPFTRIGRMDAIFFEDGRPCDDGMAFFRIDSPDAQESLMRYEGDADTIIIETGDWSVIPLENMIARFGGTGREVLAVASTREDAELFLSAMETGVDGIVVRTDDPEDLGGFADLISSSPDAELSEVVVTAVRPVGMGDRACIDACSIMSPGEGMLVGSHSGCLFLIQSESEENGYVATRPFRVNAGAIHSYIEVPDGTRYLSEMACGDPVLICDRNGRTRIATVGRCKIESRPMMMASATDGSREHSIIVQNAETIRFVTRDGSIPVSSLSPGDRVLARLSSEGRHFGMAVQETISERR